MSTSDRNAALWVRLAADIRSPFCERDLRKLRWQLAKRDCAFSFRTARLKLAVGLEYLARSVRSAPDANPVRPS